MADCDEFRGDFTDAQEELEYWKHQAHHFRTVFREVDEEMIEFKESSKELEKELEAMLELNEDELKELRQRNAKLNVECESLKEKLEVQQEESYMQLTELETQLSVADALKAENAKYIRKLEQNNDDLERTNRATIVTIEDFEQRLNHAIERNAFLESELDEKQELSITVQRLRDEARDLSQELAVRQKKDVTTEQNDLKGAAATPTKPSVLPVLTRQSSGASPSIIRGNNLSQPSTPTREQNGSFQNGTTSKAPPLTPSARISALNIVGELLRKVGALETKLSTCRNYVRETPQKNTKSSSRLDAPGWEANGRSNGSKGSSMKISV